MATRLPLLLTLGCTTCTLEASVGATDVRGDLCTLSDDDTRQLSAAFAPIYQLSTSEPRCINCHGAVVPFGPTADRTHGGGRNKVVMQPGTQTVDEDATFAQCQACHSAMPGWRLPPATMNFTGLTQQDLCVHFKQNMPEESTVLAHFAAGQEPFIREAFLGTRGLNAQGQEIVATDRPFQPEPPSGVTAEGLERLANAWIDGFHGEYQASSDCGCVPHHYALHIAETAGQVDHGVQMQPGAGDVKLTFQDVSHFTGQGDTTRTFTGTLPLDQGASCAVNATHTLHWTASGTVDPAGPGTAPRLHVKLHWEQAAVADPSPCTARGMVLSLPLRGPAASSESLGSMLDHFDLEGTLGATFQYAQLRVPIPYIGYASGTISLVQTD